MHVCLTLSGLYDDEGLLLLRQFQALGISLPSFLPLYSTSIRNLCSGIEGQVGTQLINGRPLNRASSLSRATMLVNFHSSSFTPSHLMTYLCPRKFNREVWTGPARQIKVWCHHLQQSFFGEPTKAEWLRGHILTHFDWGYLTLKLVQLQRKLQAPIG